MIEKLKGLYYKDIKIADVGYVINLPHRTDRKESVIKILNELEITGYEFIDGVILDNPEYTKFGCTQSFINIFEKFLSTTSKNIIIFEDDIKLMNQVNKKDIDRIFNNWDSIINNYDVVALGTKLLPRSEIIINEDIIHNKNGFPSLPFIVILYFLNCVKEIIKHTIGIIASMYIVISKNTLFI